jgi:hypothetical protein
MIAYAGLIYWLLGPVSAYIGWKRGSARVKVEEAEAGLQPAEA